MANKRRGTTLHCGLLKTQLVPTQKRGGFLLSQLSTIILKLAVRNPVAFSRGPHKPARLARRSEAKIPFAGPVPGRYGSGSGGKKSGALLC